MYPDFKELLSASNVHSAKYLHVTAKLASGRPQDLADVDALRKAQESQQ
jgi:hypothetical protein